MSKYLAMANVAHIYPTENSAKVIINVIIIDRYCVLYDLSIVITRFTLFDVIFHMCGILWYPETCILSVCRMLNILVAIILNSKHVILT